MQDKKQIVNLQSIFESLQWKNNSAKLPLAIGKDEKGEVRIADLAKLSHILISGMTGSGKSVCLNSIILGLLSKFSPDELRFIMADGKALEMSSYKNVPHLQFPILTESGDILQTFEWCVDEMERRYTFLADAKCKAIYDYNSNSDKKLPYIVFILSEISSLMRNEKKLAENIENAIVKICQKGRAAGIHLIISTSCTCKDVITPILKFNFPTSIAFRVGSADCSKVILDKTGAEKLKGCGDMLMQLSSEGKLLRCQGAYVDDKMIKEFIDALVPCKAPEIDQLDLPIENMESIAEEIKKFIRSDDTQGFLEAVKFAVSTGKAGASYLQRHLHIGYNHAAKYMDLLRRRGVIKK